MGARQLGGSDHFFIRSLWTTKADVIHHRVAKEKTVLQDDADLLTQAGQGDIAHIDAINRYRATGDIIEAGQQVDQRGFAGAGGADNRNGLARFGHQIHIAQNRFVTLVFGIHPGIDHPSLDRRHGFGVPLLLNLRHLVEQVKDAFAAGNRALDIGPHNGDLGNRLIQPLDIAQERDNQAE